MKLEFSNEEIKFLYEALENSYAVIEDTKVSFYDSMAEKLKRKLHFTFVLSNDDLDKIHSSHYEKENIFSNHNLFLGSGIHSLNEASLLHKRLEYAISELGGLQQGTGFGCQSEIEWHNCLLQNKQAEEEIRKTLIDIISAFGLSLDDLKEANNE